MDGERLDALARAQTTSRRALLRRLAGGGLAALAAGRQGRLGAYAQDATPVAGPDATLGSAGRLGTPAGP